MDAVDREVAEHQQNMGEMEASSDENDQNQQQMDEDEEEIDMEGEDMEIQPNSQPPEVPAEGTYVDALNEAGVEQERIEHH